MKIFAVTGLIVLVGLSCITESRAEQRSGITVSPMYGLTRFSDDIDDDRHWSLGLGYQFESPLAIELVYASLDSEMEVTGADADMTRWHLDGLYHFNVASPLRPYVSLGMGKTDYDVSTGDFDVSTLNAGIGIKYELGEGSGIRGELKFFHGNGDDEDELVSALSLGFYHVFGGSSAPMAASAPMDSDGDGVIDASDACPGTVAGVPVNARGCPADDDGDGVYNHEDDCPGTGDRRARIDPRGCYVMLNKPVRIDLNVEFDNDSSDARPTHNSEVERVARFMQTYPKTKVVIEGHTDSRGSAVYNQGLSERRAATVAEMLVEKFGIAAGRVSSAGYGESRPIASNETDAGRQQNRRVVGVVEATKETRQQK